MKAILLKRHTIRAAKYELPQLRKKLRQKNGQFLIYFYELQEDPPQQQILQSAKRLRREHDMSFKESIRQAISLRKELFDKVWPDHGIKEEEPTQGDNDDDNDQDEEETL
jgi:hypothetical protein